MKIYAILALTFFLGGCRAVAVYEPPTVTSIPGGFTRTINKPFDEVWEDLIEYCSSTYFGIDNFEKDSGLLTLSFGSRSPEQFITGGHWEIDSYVPVFHFKGDYVEYQAQHQNAQLLAKMNVSVRESGPGKTVVKVNTRYVFTSRTMVDYRVVVNSWAFNTGGSDSIMPENSAKDTPAFRTICPTHAAERDILDALGGVRD